MTIRIVKSEQLKKKKSDRHIRQEIACIFNGLVFLFELSFLIITIWDDRILEIRSQIAARKLAESLSVEKTFNRAKHRSSFESNCFTVKSSTDISTGLEFSEGERFRKLSSSGI